MKKSIEKCRSPPDAVLLPVSFEEMALPKPESLLSKWFLDRRKCSSVHHVRVWHCDGI